MRRVRRERRGARRNRTAASFCSPSAPVRRHGRLRDRRDQRHGRLRRLTSALDGNVVTPDDPLGFAVRNPSHDNGGVQAGRRPPVGPRP